MVRGLSQLYFLMVVEASCDEVDVVNIFGGKDMAMAGEPDFGGGEDVRNGSRAPAVPDRTMLFVVLGDQ